MRVGDREIALALHLLKIEDGVEHLDAMVSWYLRKSMQKVVGHQCPGGTLGDGHLIFVTTANGRWVFPYSPGNSTDVSRSLKT